MTTQEKIDLLNRAKEAYYNTGVAIMTDMEYDELEAEVGLENQNYIGARSEKYTVKHPYIMGSLSKVQIKKDSEGNIDWDKYFDETCKYINYNYEKPLLIITPKYDGCSFEAHVVNGNIVSISTRGDGEYGKDIYKHVIGQFDGAAYQLNSDDYTLRGEVLINRTVFNGKYSEDFVNPRSFVSGVLNTDYDDTDQMFMEELNDLSIVIYDVRFKKNGIWNDSDWQTYKHRLDYCPEFCEKIYMTSSEQLKECYEKFEEYRRNCEFALDGFVIKPHALMRMNNTEDERPKDCVAIKFVPMLEETEIVDIVWSYGKTNELRPVIVVKPVIMDGKEITRASGHNYGYMMDNKLSIGCKVVLSLAGDIIPYIYKITDCSAFDENKMCLNGMDTRVDGCHIYLNMDENAEQRLKFVASAVALKIPKIGKKTAEKMFDTLIPMYPKLVNILQLFPLSGIMYNILGANKSAENIALSMAAYAKTLTLVDIIKSFCFEGCGDAASEVAARILSKLDYDASGLSFESYSWALDENSAQTQMVINTAISNHVGPLQEEIKIVSSVVERTQVMLTGDPSKCTNYKTKAKWLDAHPEYVETTKMSECQILFTNDLNSSSAKMKKAQKAGIEIKQYY